MNTEREALYADLAESCRVLAHTVRAQPHVYLRNSASAVVDRPWLSEASPAALRAVEAAMKDAAGWAMRRLSQGTVRPPTVMSIVRGTSHAVLAVGSSMLVPDASLLVHRWSDAAAGGAYERDAAALWRRLHSDPLVAGAIATTPLVSAMWVCGSLCTVTAVPAVVGVEERPAFAPLPHGCASLVRQALDTIPEAGEAATYLQADGRLVILAPPAARTEEDPADEGLRIATDAARTLSADTDDVVAAARPYVEALQALRRATTRASTPELIAAAAARDSGDALRFLHAVATAEDAIGRCRRYLASLLDDAMGHASEHGHAHSRGYFATAAQAAHKAIHDEVLAQLPDRDTAPRRWVEAVVALHLEPLAPLLAGELPVGDPSPLEGPSAAPEPTAALRRWTDCLRSEGEHEPAATGGTLSDALNDAVATGLEWLRTRVDDADAVDVCAVARTVLAAQECLTHLGGDVAPGTVFAATAALTTAHRIGTNGAAFCPRYHHSPLLHRVATGLQSSSIRRLPDTTRLGDMDAVVATAECIAAAIAASNPRAEELPDPDDAARLPAETDFLDAFCVALAAHAVGAPLGPHYVIAEYATKHLAVRHLSRPRRQFPTRARALDVGIATLAAILMHRDQLAPQATHKPENESEESWCAVWGALKAALLDVSTAVQCHSHYGSRTAVLAAAPTIVALLRAVVDACGDRTLLGHATHPRGELLLPLVAAFVGEVTDGVRPSTLLAVQRLGRGLVARRAVGAALLLTAGPGSHVDPTERLLDTGATEEGAAQTPNKQPIEDGAALSDPDMAENPSKGRDANDEAAAPREAAEEQPAAVHVRAEEKREASPKKKSPVDAAPPQRAQSSRETPRGARWRRKRTRPSRMMASS
jgi:hypothetical protein